MMRYTGHNKVAIALNDLLAYIEYLAEANRMLAIDESVVIRQAIKALSEIETAEGNREVREKENELMLRAAKEGR